MAHLHEMRDTDTHYVVDPITRNITHTPPSGSVAKTILIQYDHLSEILTFEMPRYIEEHDMTLCNRIEVHYTNKDAGSSQINYGVREIEDFGLAEDDENTVVWSWTVSNNATQLVGPLAFAFRFACLTDDEVDYAWSTSSYSGIAISKGIYNAEEIVEEYIDILEQWSRKLGVSINDIDQTVEATEENGINIIVMTLSDGTEETIRIRNGKTPIRGVDYWTESDKNEVINEVLNSLLIAEEAGF